jgi:hypothetical protein
MGAYAVPSNQPFIVKGPLKTKRERGRLEEMMDFFKDTSLSTDEETGELLLMRGNEIVGKFVDEEENE